MAKLTKPKSYALGILFICSFALQHSFAQALDPVSWELHIVENHDEHFLEFHAQIEEGWYLYSQDVEEGGPIPTSFSLRLNEGDLTSIYLAEQSKHSIVKYDEMFQMELKKFKQDAKFSYPLDSQEGHGTLYSQVEFMCCNDVQCLAPKTIELSINLK